MCGIPAVGTMEYFSHHPTHWNLQDPEAPGDRLCEARQMGSLLELHLQGQPQCHDLDLSEGPGLKPQRLPLIQAASPGLMVVRSQ